MAEETETAHIASRNATFTAADQHTTGAQEHYRLNIWGEGYFGINEQGHAVANCNGHALDIHDLVQRFRRDGHGLPVLMRFMDILSSRIDTLYQAFEEAMRNANYPGHYTLVYPIKVNQQHGVVSRIAHHPMRVGLEAGSKPELLCVLALANRQSTIICNGYKDLEYIRLALIGSQFGLRTYIVIEKLSEIQRIVDCVQDMGISPLLGIRVRLSAVASSNWQNTGGEKSKFGLHSSQVLYAIRCLREHGLLQNLKLLHFHIGSQVGDIRDFGKALKEGARYYQELRALQVPIETVDIGGGLGVDYEGTGTANPCSINYTIQTYADRVISAFRTVCEESGSCPDIITESGRAITAHHALLVSNVVEVDSILERHPAPSRRTSEARPVQQLIRLQDSLARGDALAIYRDAEYYYQQVLEGFSDGLLSLAERAEAEFRYYNLCQRLHLQLCDTALRDTALRDRLEYKLAHRYICNFSLFQSMPDSWAIDQIFPVMPIHRLHESPMYNATIQDLSCDSDGRINYYVRSDGIAGCLPLPEPQGQELLIGMFLLGAYQEVLGDIHNLFGDASAVNIAVCDDGTPVLEAFHAGDLARDLLNQVGTDPHELHDIYNKQLAEAGISDRLRQQYLDELLNRLAGSTYLE